MNGFDVCRLFTALNNHFFQPTYDYFRYKGGVPLKPETYDAKRPDEKHRYERLAKKFHDQEELENFIIANLLESKKRLWVGAIFGGETDDIYLRWQGRIQSAQYNLISEVKRLMDETDSFNHLFKCEDHQHPQILKAHMRGDISLESFVFLDLCVNFVPSLEQHLGDDRNWTLVQNKAVKYRPFLERLNMNIPALCRALQDALKDMGVSH